MIEEELGMSISIDDLMGECSIEEDDSIPYKIELNRLFLGSGIKTKKIHKEFTIFGKNIIINFAITIR